ncbi:MAG: FixG Ig-like domain-containing protein, partial [Sulfurimonas sp.]
LYDEHRGGTIYNETGNKEFTKQKDLQAVNETAECTTCEKCVTVCPTHIDIRKGLQLECINCLECVDACTTVMGKLGKPSLVTWSSDYEIVDRKGKTQFFRPKVLAYGVILIIVAVILGLMGTTKEHMLLNINKETQAYSIENIDGKNVVENSYTFLVQNIQKEKMKYFFDVSIPKEFKGSIEVVRPLRPFTVIPEKKKRKIVILRAVGDLGKSEKVDTIIPIKVFIPF